MSLLCKLTGIALLTLAVSASGGPIFFTGFEPPTYTVGNINGQDGWAEFHPTDSFDAVQSTIVKSGAQAAWVIPTGKTNSQTGMFHSDAISGPLIDLNADIYLASSSTQNEWQFAATGPGLAPFIGGIDVLPTGEIDAITLGFANIGTFSYNTWHHVDLLFNFSSQTYTIALDGSTLATNLAFCGDNGPCSTAGPIAEGTFSSFFDVFATIGSNDLGAIDNLSLSSVAVPEPSSYLLIFSGLAVLVLLRRRG